MIDYKITLTNDKWEVSTENVNELGKAPYAERKEAFETEVAILANIFHLNTDGTDLPRFEEGDVVKFNSIDGPIVGTLFFDKGWPVVVTFNRHDFLSSRFSKYDAPWRVRCLTTTKSLTKCFAAYRLVKRSKPLVEERTMYTFELGDLVFTIDGREGFIETIHDSFNNKRVYFVRLFKTNELIEVSDILIEDDANRCFKVEAR